MLKYLITLSLILSSFALNALSYEEALEAYEEAMENQSVAVYKLKCQREEEKRIQMREGFRRAAELRAQQK